MRPDSKSGDGEIHPGVRIPPLPPLRQQVATFRWPGKQPLKSDFGQDLGKKKRDTPKDAAPCPDCKEACLRCLVEKIQP